MNILFKFWLFGLVVVSCAFGTLPQAVSVSRTPTLVQRLAPYKRGLVALAVAVAGTGTLVALVYLQGRRGRQDLSQPRFKQNVPFKSAELYQGMHGPESLQRRSDDSGRGQGVGQSIVQRISSFVSLQQYSGDTRSAGFFIWPCTRNYRGFFLNVGGDGTLGPLATSLKYWFSDGNKFDSGRFTDTFNDVFARYHTGLLLDRAEGYLYRFGSDIHCFVPVVEYSPLAPSKRIKLVFNLLVDQRLKDWHSFLSMMSTSS